MRDMAEVNRELASSAEDKIRIRTATKGIRVHEFFHDYDRLRSGFVTINQFKRVLNQHFNVLLSQDEENSLISKYNLKGDDVNYRAFCATINQSLPENDLSTNPEHQTFKNPEYLGTFRSTQFLEETTMSQVEMLLTSLSSYYSKNGMDILSLFRDFDKAKSGAVTESQFYRGLVEPKLNQEEIALLVTKYRDPQKPGKVNYMNLHYDILSFINKNNKKTTKLSTNSTIFKEKNPNFSVQEILDKVILASFKNGIRISEFFRDYDKLRCGMITDNQFNCALSLACEKQANLSRTEIAQLIEYYREDDGRCAYKQFVNQIENAFSIPEWEKQPTIEIKRPARGLLGRSVNYNLTPEDEEILRILLLKMKERVQKRRLQVFPFFKDFDRSKAYSRNCTKLQFGRVLSMLDLMPNDKEYRLLCEKFEERVSGDVNYPAFCHAIDDEWFSNRINDEPEIPQSTNHEISNAAVTTVEVNVNDLIGRVRNHVLSNRIRIKEFFEDIDPLRSGRMTKSQFLRCLSSIGISSIGALNLSKAQLQLLVDRYACADDQLRVNWKDFENEIESVFTIPELEKDPNIRVPPASIFEMPPAGTVDFKNANENHINDFNEAMSKWRRKVEQRRLDCWPPFKDFDPLNHGHVTMQQFRQSMSVLDLTASEGEMIAVAAKFMNDIGFNYAKFLNELVPRPEQHPVYSKLQQEIVDMNSNNLLEEFRPKASVQETLKKIKNLVAKKRARIYEWLHDHDKLNSGRLNKDTFRRALDLCNFELKEAEYAMLEDYYKSPKDAQAVEYKQFCNDIETIFVDSDVEKNPLLEPKQYLVTKEISNNSLEPKFEEIVARALVKLAERVKKYRLQLFPRFEDFDRVKNGFVSQNQFRRVLSDLDMATLLTEIEFKKICEKFCVQIGTRDDVDYNSFCENLYHLGGFEHRKP